MSERLKSATTLRGIPKPDMSAGRSSRSIVDYKGYTHHASQEEPQYEIKSDKTDHVAMHKGSALQ
jgi:hypothetical protein